MICSESSDTGTLEQGKNAGLRTIDDALEDDALEKILPIADSCPYPRGSCDHGSACEDHRPPGRDA
jgi:hypothetical protein